MRIGIIAPTAYPIPPKGYGGTEQVVFNLVQGLVDKGHQVTLFAAEGSNTKAKLDSKFTHELSSLTLGLETIYIFLRRVNYIAKQSHQFDIIHNHDSFLPISQSDFFDCPMVTTFHSTLKGMVNDDPMRKILLEQTNAVTISNSQRKDFPQIKYRATVYNGTVDLNEYTLGAGGDNLAWIGRFNHSKGVSTAVEVALDTKHPIKLGAAISSDIQQKYFDELIKPHVDGTNVDYLGEVNKAKKIDLLQGSKAFLMPIEWEEPFGLVVIEANACGTPVVAYNRGSMSEIIKDGVNGFLITPGDKKKFAEAVEHIYNLSPDEYQKLRASSRQHIQENFTIEKMVSGYEKVYENIVAKQTKKWWQFGK